MVWSGVGDGIGATDVDADGVAVSAADELGSWLGVGLTVGDGDPEQAVRRKAQAVMPTWRADDLDRLVRGSMALA